jgi:dTDP-4-amino-4,6-dideoxygalactose transaminase
MNIPIRNLSITDADEKHELLSIFERVLDHGQFILGHEVERFEKLFADFCSTKYCVGVANGTSALYLILKALGIGPNDEVITTPLSWIATLNCIHMTGATPVFADISDDLNINADSVQNIINSNTKAILPVHFTGRICDMDKILSIAQKENLMVLEDSAQAAGAVYKGRPAGSFGYASAFSFNPMKVFGALGEGGAITTNDEILRDKLRSLRYLGTVNREICINPELNHKIDALQAAFLSFRLPKLSNKVSFRINLAQHYNKLLKGVVKTPVITDTGRSVFFDYTIIAENRDKLFDRLSSRGIEARIKHAPLMCDQPAYSYLNHPNIPHARDLIKKILTLPLHDKMTLRDIEHIAGIISEFYGNN